MPTDEIKVLLKEINLNLRTLKPLDMGDLMFKQNQENTKEIIDKLEELKNKEVKEVSLTSLETAISQVEKAVSGIAIPEIPEQDFESITKELVEMQKLIKNIKYPEFDTSKIISAISAIKFENKDYSKKFDKLLEAIQNAPQIDVEKLGEVIGKNTSISGGGGGAVEVKNKAQQQINPATEEKQDSLITKQTTSNFHLDEVNKQTLLLHKILVTLRKIDLHLSEASGTTFEDREIDEED